MWGRRADERLNAMPDVLKRQLLGPYVLGMRFLARGHVEGLQTGFPTKDVDAAWARPPQSSEQISTPRSIGTPRNATIRGGVAIPNPSRILGTAGRERLGCARRAHLGSLVGARTPEPADFASASCRDERRRFGLGGDRYELWTKGGAALVLLATVWDTAADAEDFAARPPSWPRGARIPAAGAKVGIVAGVSGARREALLAMLTKP